MSPRERIMILRLYEKVSKNKEYAEKIGIEIAVEQNCKYGKRLGDRNEK